MPFISLTRLRVRSVRHLPAFGMHTLRSVRQIRQAPGFRSGALLADRRWVFWTLSSWDDMASMRAYMASGAHRAAMPHLLDWCDEAAVAHWEQQSASLPSWSVADRRLRAEGRPSKVRHPNRYHADLSYPPPRRGPTGPIAAATP
jgi:quinol monooxygenase YgiN